PVTVRPETSVSNALAIAREHAIDHLLLAESDNLVGVACTCDLERAPGRAPASTCMKSPIVTIDGATTIREAADVMRSRGIGCLPVVAGRLLMGLVTRRDLIRAGVPIDALADACSSCGARHHLDSRAAGAPFCVECFECGSQKGAELGAGD
ncbi:MAG TPA: CBS domain-containing protein, partial [Planctomycetota bacterium]|nr:CBS domain-containing protein [Planctomycetota bacterium]